jgi:hypothetical protein
LPSEVSITFIQAFIFDSPRTRLSASTYLWILVNSAESVCEQHTHLLLASAKSSSNYRNMLAKLRAAALWLALAYLLLGCAASSNDTCVLNPSNSSCAGYQLPTSVVNGDVTMMCDMMPWMLGRSPQLRESSSFRLTFSQAADWMRCARLSPVLAIRASTVILSEFTLASASTCQCAPVPTARTCVPQAPLLPSAT